MRTFCIACLLVIVSVPAGSRTRSRRDGNWWRATSEEGKIVYMTGFFDGRKLGESFSAPGTLSFEGQRHCPLTAFSPR